jgi:hypothetical protein
VRISRHWLRGHISRLFKIVHDDRNFARHPKSEAARNLTPFQKDAGDPNKRRTENAKKQLLATLRAGGLERDPLKRAKQERARNCDLMSVVSGLGSLWKRVGRVGFPPFGKQKVWTQP